jgi:hypothetical protein
MLFLVTWGKIIDTVHPFVHKMREYARRPIAPYLFGAAVYSGPTTDLTAPATARIRAIQGVKPLLKFEITVVDEADVVPHTTAWLALRIASSTSTDISIRSDPEPPSPAEIAKKRVQMLRTHFPVTLERLRRSSMIKDFLRELSPADVRAWQIEQAICNLILSKDAGLGLHYRGISAGKLDEQITRALRDRFELADNSSLPILGIDEVRTQILADANALLRYMRLARAEDLPAAQAALRSASALEGPSAISV